jgi:uncharacterized protein (TIGR00369 family)
MPRPRRGWGDEAPPDPHIWNTLGYRSVGVGVLEWDATPEYCFQDGRGGFIVHGGMVTTLLDTTMGGACWATLAEHESFLTADLRVEFLRSARPGTLRAEGRVVQRNRRVAFCSADLYQEGELIASSRCTQIIRSNRLS